MADGSEARMFGDPEVVETPHGIIYRFRGLASPLFFRLRTSLFLLVVGMVPAAATLAALEFLVAFADQLPWHLVALPCLFVLQAGLVAGLFLWVPWGYFRRDLLFDLLGRHELELRDGVLYWGTRACRLRRGYRHAVSDLRCLLVCCYTSAGGGREAHLGVVPLSGQDTTFYCCCCDEQEVLALARDLHRHLRRQYDLPLEIREVGEPEAMAMAGMNDPVPPWPLRPFLWLRWYVWYPWHVGGLAGLVALLLAVRSLNLGLPGWVYALFAFGFLLEVRTILYRTDKAREAGEPAGSERARR